MEEEGQVCFGMVDKERKGLVMYTYGLVMYTYTVDTAVRVQLPEKRVCFDRYST